MLGTESFYIYMSTFCCSSQVTVGFNMVLKDSSNVHVVQCSKAAQGGLEEEMALLKMTWSYPSFLVLTPFPEHGC